MPIIEEVNGLTISEISTVLGIKPRTAEKRLERLGIKPITREALYPDNAIEAIRDVRMGRPSKPKPDK
jgi:predicted ArsR family transcriptional regulator